MDVLNVGFYRAEAAAARVFALVRSQHLIHRAATLVVVSPPTYERSACSVEEIAKGRLRLLTRAFVEPQASLQIKAGDAAIIFGKVARRRMLRNGFELEVAVKSALTSERGKKRGASASHLKKGRAA